MASLPYDYFSHFCLFLNLVTKMQTITLLYFFFLFICFYVCKCMKSQYSDFVTHAHTFAQEIKEQGFCIFVLFLLSLDFFSLLNSMCPSLLYSKTYIGFPHYFLHTSLLLSTHSSLVTQYTPLQVIVSFLHYTSHTYIQSDRSTPQHQGQSGAARQDTHIHTTSPQHTVTFLEPNLYPIHYIIILNCNCYKIHAPLLNKSYPTQPQDKTIHSP